MKNENGIKERRVLPTDKKTLKQYQYIQKEIDVLLAEKQALICTIGRVKPLHSGLSGGGKSDPAGNIVCKVDFLERRIDKKIDDLIKLRIKIEAVIDKLEQQESLLMRMRYIEGKKWEQIAQELHYDYRHVIRKHGEILQKIKNW